jgi:hypothetical protein
MNERRRPDPGRRRIMIPQKEHHSYQDHTGGAYVSRTLESWDVREADFPNTGTPVEQLCFLLHYAVLAPSVHNTQPWLFKVVDDAVELYADRTRALPVIDPDDRELTISCGAALLHLRLALRHFGYAGDIATFPDPDDPDLLACIHLGNRIDVALQRSERSSRRSLNGAPIGRPLKSERCRKMCSLPCRRQRIQKEPGSILCKGRRTATLWQT